MREIKFRGKSTSSYEGEAVVNEGDWVYGDLIVDGKNAYIVHGVVECNDEYIALEEWCPVDIKTVGQYTGLKDKNGVEIYEDDIVSITTNWVSDLAPDKSPTTTTRVVEFVNGSFQLGHGGFFSNSFIEQGELEVIGNIYSNPELLGGTDDTPRV